MEIRNSKLEEGQKKHHTFRSRKVVRDAWAETTPAPGILLDSRREPKQQAGRQRTHKEHTRNASRKTIRDARKARKKRVKYALRRRIGQRAEVSRRLRRRGPEQLQW